MGEACESSAIECSIPHPKSSDKESCGVAHVGVAVLSNLRHITGALCDFYRAKRHGSGLLRRISESVASIVGAGCDQNVARAANHVDRYHGCRTPGSKQCHDEHMPAASSTPASSATCPDTTHQYDVDPHSRAGESNTASSEILCLHDEKSARLSSVA